MPKIYRNRIGKNNIKTYQFCRDFETCKDWIRDIQNGDNPKNKGTWHYHINSDGAIYPYALMDVFSI
tara:strand:- start:213 stop:413 length:201 start_codon:yes stop_codon:yes gene_type:complete